MCPSKVLVLTGGFGVLNVMVKAFWDICWWAQCRFLKSLSRTKSLFYEGEKFGLLVGDESVSNRWRRA